MSSPNSYFPAFIDVEKKPFLLIGGGLIATAKLETLVQYTRNITVVSIEFSDEIKKMVQAFGLKSIHSAYEKEHLRHGEIIIAATNDRLVNTEIKEDCRNLKKIINVVDDPDSSDFIFGAIVKKGDLNIAISTSGLSPVMARVIKEKIHRIIPEGFDLLNNFLRKNTKRVREKLSELQPRRLFWQDFLESPAAEDIASGSIMRGKKQFDEKLSGMSNRAEKRVYFLGAGPGDAELLTLKALKYLSRADVVIYDRLVSSEILAHARRDALKINVGKRKDSHPVPQDQINRLIVEHALENNIVVRLKGGDATVFSHIAEEAEAVKNAKIDYQIIPGVGSVFGAAAYGGFPLTSRTEEKSLRILTYYKTEQKNQKYWENLVESGDFLAFYMSSHNACCIAQGLISAGKSPETPACVIEQATTPFQKTYKTTLENFRADLGSRQFLSPSILLIGNNLKWQESCSWIEESQSGIYFSDTPEPIDSDRTGKKLTAV